MTTQPTPMFQVAQYRPARSVRPEEFHSRKATRNWIRNHWPELAGMRLAIIHPDGREEPVLVETTPKATRP